MTQHTLSPDRIAQLVAPYFSDAELAPVSLYDQLASYLDLLLKWNARTNLTAIHEPEEIVRRHFGESLFAALQLGIGGTLLDFGSGAGFPGLPIQLLFPQRPVTLAESQNKKASFLREAVRTLGLKTEVWASRVESMPASRTFDVVVLRAVDNMEEAILAASQRASGRLAIMMSAHHAVPAVPGFSLTGELPQPGENPLKIALLDRDEGN